MRETVLETSSRRVRHPEAAVILVGALFAAAIARLWLAPLASGFWLDETGTVWIIRDGLREAWLRCLLWPGQSLLYSAIAALAWEIGGPREWVLRLPSTLATAAAAYVVYRIGRRLLSRDAALAAAAVFACLEPVAFAAADARPYAWGTLAVASALWMLVRWHDTGRWRYGVAYCFCAAATVYFHYLFAPMFAVHAMYSVWRVRHGASVRWSSLWGAAGVIAVLLSGLAPQVRELLRIGNSASFAGTPAFGDLFGTLSPPFLICGIAGGALLARYASPSLKFRRPAARADAMMLLGIWALGPPLLLFGVSMATSAKVFVPRYLLCSAPALALIAGWVINAFEPLRARAVVVGAVLLAAVASAGISIHPSHGGDWRAAIEATHGAAADTPVLIRSGFVESGYSDWFQDPRRSGYLFAPLDIYPPGGRVIRLPFQFSDRAVSILEAAANNELASSRGFLLLTSGDASYEYWLIGRLSRFGCEMSRRRFFGGPLDSLRLVEFQLRPAEDAGRQH